MTTWFVIASLILRANSSFWWRGRSVPQYIPPDASSISQSVTDEDDFVLVDSLYGPALTIGSTTSTPIPIEPAEIVSVTIAPEDVTTTTHPEVVTLTSLASPPRPAVQYIGMLSQVKTYQDEHDAAAFEANSAPNFALESAENSPHGDIVLGRKVASTEFSTLFEMSNSNEWIVKYQTESDVDFMNEVGEFFELKCDNVHPLFREYWFTKLIEALEVAPIVHMISGPSRLSKVHVRKTDFKMKPEEYARLQRYGVRVRYMVIERLGYSVHEVSSIYASEFGWTPPEYFTFVVQTGIIMVRMLEKIHLQGKIVHGDIHLGNIMLTNESPRFSLRLIDFGKAAYFSDIENLVARAQEAGDDQLLLTDPTMGFNHPYLSPWEMRGFYSSKRDDIYRAVLSIVFLVTGKHGEQYFKLHNDDIDHCLRRKETFPLFGMPSGPELLDVLPVKDETKWTISSLLDTTLDLARNSPRIDSTPHYHSIRLALQDILRLLPK